LFRIACCLLWAFCGCSSEHPHRPVKPAQPVCASAPSSGWGGSWGIEPVFVGGVGTEGTSGAAFIDSVLIVYQRQLGEIWRVDLAGRMVGAFGREGPGPGEFTVGRRSSRVFSHGRVSWVDVVRDTIAVFDGNSIQYFDPIGAYRGQALALRDILKGRLYFSKRIRLMPGGGGILIDIEERTGSARSARPHPRPYGIWLMSDGEFRPVFTMRLPPLPRDENGAQFQSVREAQPIWDLAGRCVVVSDGSSPWIILASLDGPTVDTIPIPEMEGPRTRDEDESALRRRLGASGREIPPVLPIRISALSVDPDRWVWLQGAQPEPSVAESRRAVPVVRLSTATGEVVRDTVPAFPSAFGPRGMILGVTRDSSGYRRLGAFFTIDTVRD
jgi:hypothetical protein